MKVCKNVRASKVNFIGMMVSLFILLFSQINWAQKTKTVLKKQNVESPTQQLNSGMSLEQFLLTVRTHNAKAQALSLQLEASEERRLAGDLELTPILGANYSYLSDQSLPQSVPGTTKFLNRTSELYVSKKFSSGTNAKLFAQGKDYEFVGASAAYPGKYATGALGIMVSQSLWKDFFGAATRLRQNRELFVSQLEKQQAEYELRQFMSDAEVAYWNFLYKKEEKKQRLESLERSTKILNWVKGRESDGISDRSDRYNSEALVSARQLFLLNSEDDLRSAEQAIRDYLSLDQNVPVPVISGNIGMSRPIKGKFTKGQRILRADAYLHLLESKAKNIISNEVKDGLKPDLTLQATYKTNSVEEDLNKATNKWTDTKTPTTMIGVQFTYLFDTSAKNSKASAARKDALASEMKAMKLVRESESAWSELQRKYDELSQKIAIAENIKDFQLKRAKEEQMKLSRGRSVTNQVVTSEEDASNAELTVLQLKAEQRKLEAMTRSYFEVPDHLVD
jgi:outer membrane protein TolC